MENSFKPGYDKQTKADGSIELTFKAKRLSPQAAVGFGTVLLFAMFPVSCAMTLPVAGMFIPKGKPLGDVSLMLWLSMTIVVYAVILWLIVNTRSTVVIKPKEGLMFAGKTLPYQDIKQIGTIHHPNARDKNGAAFVYADTQGSQVQITKYIPLALAEAVAEELKLHSGMPWGRSVSR